MLSIQSDQEIRQIIGLYAPEFQPKPWSLTPMTSGFSGAAVFQLTAHSKKYVLRFWSGEERSISKLDALTRLLEDAFHRGVTYIAPPIRQIKGDVATFLSNGNMVHLEPWLPGTAETELPFSAPKRDNAMRSLAHLHAALAKHVPLAKHCSWVQTACQEKSPSLVFRLKKIETYLQQGIATAERSVSLLPAIHLQQIQSDQQRLHFVFQSQAEKLCEELRRASRVELPLQPVFRDVWRDHILFTAEQVTGIIDPAAFGTDSILTDLTRLLGSIAGNDWQAWSDAISVYQTVRPLNNVEQKLIGIFDNSNLLLSAVGCFERILKTFTCSSELGEEMGIRLLDRLEEYLQRLEFYNPRFSFY